MSQHHPARGPSTDHPAWRELLPAWLPPDGLPGPVAGAPFAFSDPDDETASVLGGADVVAPLVTRGALRLTGPDRIDFLHGQVSHDLRGQSVGTARAALRLDHRGRPHADLVMVRREHDVYLAVDDGRATAVAAGLEAHIVFDQVAIEDVSHRIASFVVAGDRARAALSDALGGAALPAPAGACLQLPWNGADVLLHARPRGIDGSLDVHLLVEQLPELWRRLLSAGARSVGERALAAARVAAGLASVACEGEGALPQEAGLEDRISYRKGCYLGQEIMARIEARGTVRRRLARLAFAERPGPGSEQEVLAEDGRVVGRVGTVACLPGARWVGLAVIRSELERGDRVRALGAPAEVECIDIGRDAPPS